MAQGKGPWDPKVKTVEINFSKSLVNPFAKVFPSKAEIAAGVYQVPKLENGNKVVIGKNEKGFDVYAMEPALDKDGNTVPVQISETTGKPLPYITNIFEVSSNPKQRSSFEALAMAKGRVDISLPNKDVESNLRKENISVPASFISGVSDNVLKLTIKPNAYKNGLKLNVPTDPYTVDKKGNEIAVATERRDYTNKAGQVSQKLMAPVGFDAKGQPVWDDGKTTIIKSSDSKRISEAQAKGVEFTTYDTAVKYHYRSDNITVNDLKERLAIKFNQPQAEAEATAEHTAEAALEAAEVDTGLDM